MSVRGTRRRKRSPELKEDPESIFAFDSDAEGNVDSEFAGGTFEYEKPQKKKRQRKSKESTDRNASTSALCKWFGDAVYNCVAVSDEDEEAAEGDAEQDDEDEDEDVSEGEVADTSLPPPRIFRPSALSRNSQSQSQSQSQAPSVPFSQSQKEEGSTTESDDEPILPPFKKHGKSSSSSAVGDGTATESDSGLEDCIAAMTQTQTQPRETQEQSQVDDDGSATESDIDDDHVDATSDSLRPDFVRKLDQPILGPLILDDEDSVVDSLKVPGAINTFLREYQREGVRFFHRQYRAGKGALLGDDMGLGKTIQVIAFLSALMSKSGAPRDKDRRQKHIAALQDSSGWLERRELPPADATWPTALIVAPSSVVWNWQREFETWGYFEVGLYNGTREERKEVLKNFKMGRLDVVVMSFESARKDIDLLDSLAWTLVLVDEAHRLKNPNSNMTTAFGQFKCKMRIGLTGTAIQNGYEEFWTLLDWTNPGSVGTPREWKGVVSKPLRFGQSKKATDEERARYHFVARVLHDKLLPEFWLRRTKEIIKDQLPKKTDNVVFCPLTPAQIAVYKRVLALPRVQRMLARTPDDKGDLLRYLDTLIKISNHLCLILPSPQDNHEQLVRNRELAALIFPGKQPPKYAEASMQVDLCGKWLVLESLLREWRKGPTNKTLIFTKSVKLLGVLEFYLKNRHYGFVRLDGSTKQADRMPLIDQFHADPDITVFLISTMTGGVGLNLTGANKVVIFDPNWNPAHDLQAMDRAYRFGQRRDVSVYRLLGAGSLEENIYARQLYKQQQMAIGYDASIQTRFFEGIQKEKHQPGELFGLQNLFSFSESELVTKMAIEEAHITELDWALANVGGNGKTGLEAEAKKLGVDSNLSTLGALLLEEDNDPKATDKINSVLRKNGIKYTHHNDKVLVETPAERARTKQAVKKRQSMSKKPTKPGAAAEVEEWPPRRKHHKVAAPVQQSSQERLAARRNALVELGLILGSDDIAKFAESFAQKTQKEQQDILARLDRHAAASTP